MKLRIHYENREAYTFTEIMVSLTLLGFIISGILPFFLQTSTSFFVTEEKLKANNDVRKFTSQMVDRAREANHYVLYRSFSATDRDGADDRQRDGESGDFMVLIYHGTPAGTAPLITRPIRRVVGYYRASPNPSDSSQEGPVRTFDSDVDTWGVTFPSTQPIENALPSAANLSSFRQVIELSKGLSNQRLFYNFHNRCIMVKGEFVHGSAIKRVTNTYNFTVSPRG